MSHHHSIVMTHKRFPTNLQWWLTIKWPPPYWTESPVSHHHYMAVTHLCVITIIWWWLIYASPPSATIWWWFTCASLLIYGGDLPTHLYHYMVMTHLRAHHYHDMVVTHLCVTTTVRWWIKIESPQLYNRLPFLSLVWFSVQLTHCQ